MMKRPVYISVFLMVMSVVILGGCVAQEVVFTAESGVTENFELTVSTKAVLDPDLSERLSVKDVWLFQFGGTSDDAPLVGSPSYLDYSDDPVLDGDPRLVSLVTSGTANTIVAVANTHGSDIVWNVATLGMMKKAAVSVSMSEDNWSGSAKDVVMSGFVQMPVSAGDAVLIELEANVAKVRFVLNNDAASGMTLRSVALADVAAQSHYAQALTASGTMITTDYVDYPEEKAQSGTYWWYVPRNDEGKTHVRILATDADGIAYRYNIPVDKEGVEAGHFYKMSLDINKVGDPYLDGNVEKYGEVEFENANCFMVHPYPAGGVADGVTAQRRFSIPIAQVNAYWKDIRHDDARRLFSDSEWTAEVLWQDVEGLVTVLTTSGKGPNQRIVFSVKNGTYGNAVIALKKDGEILWSWHIWSTDYDPEYYEAPVAKKYVYDVPGGAVHRYGGDFWEPPAEDKYAFLGTYRDKYVMDRGLGASAPGESGFYYQYGRKDPFKSDVATFQVQRMTMDESILNPKAFCELVNNDWCSDLSTSNTWNSPTADREFKSIYDPCPPGWKIPHIDIWQNFTYSGKSGNIANDTVLQVERGLGWNVDGVIGLRYWPVGVIMDNPIFYGVGAIVGHDFKDNRVSVWSSVSHSTTNAYCMNYETSFNRKASIPKAYACQVRCVQE